MTSALRAARLLGYAGLFPFALTAIGVLGPWPAWHEIALRALIGYGAVIVTFVGAVHWGLGLASRNTEWSPRAIGWSVVPSLFAWVALLLPAAPALVTLGASLVACRIVDAQLLPRAPIDPTSRDGFERLRTHLTIGAATCVAAGLFAAIGR